MIARAIVAALWLAAGAVPAHAAGATDAPGDYAVRVPVRPAAGGSLQRLALPAEILVASRSAGLADVRVFDGRGRAVPVALSTAPPARARGAIPLRPMPILGGAAGLTVTGVSLRIEAGQQARVVRVDGTPQAGGAAETLGVLLDTRAITAPVVALALAADWPRGQPVTFTLQTSADLTDWQPLAEKTVYRTADTAAADTIGFAARNLRGRYVRITWAASTRLLSPVAIRGARAITLRAADAVRPRATILLPAPHDPHAIAFTLPFATPVSALEIAARGDDLIVPVRILGRDTRERPWTPIAAGTVFGGDRGATTFDLHGAPFRTLRIEADARTAGLVTPPRLSVRFDPVRVLFLAAGPPPFMLAAGRDGARDLFLPAASLLPDYGTATEAALPVAVVPARADPVVSITAAEDGVAWRSAALWGVLLAATALLAAMVWRLARRRAV